MSRIDQLIDAVRTRFLVQKLLDFGAWTVCCAAGAMLALVIVSRVFLVALPPYAIVIGSGVVLALVVALLLAMIYSPSREGTAVRVDEVLGLKERFSTALQARGSNDPFARAAVTEAESQAHNVSIRHRFPLRFPRHAFYSLAAIVALFLTDRFMPQFDVTGKEERQRQAQVLERKREQARDALQSALAEVMAVPKVGPAEKSLAEARRDIEALLSQEIRDPAEAVKTASRAAAEAEAAKKRIEDAQKYAAGEIQKEPFKQLAASGQGDQASDSLEQARQSLSEGQFDKAAAALRAAAENFANADAQTKARMAQDMKGLADQLAKIAQDPAVQQSIQKKLEEQGATPEQARRMTEQMARAAAGDRQAQQRVREMAENLARRNNGGMLPAPEALAPLMQQLGQMQAQMNSQQRAAEMAQATQQMSGAMDKQAQNQQRQQQQQQAQNQGRQGQQGQSPGQNQQSQQGQQAQSGQPNQQGGGQEQQMSQSGQQEGEGQSGQQPGDSQMADGQAAMEAAMAQLEAMQQEAEMAGGASGEGESGGDAGQGWGEQMGQGEGQGQGDGFGPAGPNQGGIGEGPRPGKSPAPYTVKRELSKGETNQEGRVLAGWLVKADSIKGESREQLKSLIMSAEKDAAEDVEQDRVPLRAQKAVRDYFDSMQQ